jgi:hypothetical protein
MAAVGDGADRDALFEGFADPEGHELCVCERGQNSSMP